MGPSRRDGEDGARSDAPSGAGAGPDTPPGASRAGEPRAPHGTLPGAIAEQIRTLILEGTLRPGQRIPERLFTEQLSVSRTPLREAFKTLAAEGLVELEPNRGAFIAEHTVDVIRDSIEFVELVESAAGLLAAERADDEEIREIAALHFEMKAAFLRRDRLSYYRLNQQIHAAIVAASKNEVLIHEHETVNGRLFRIRFKPNDTDERWQAAMDEHEQLLAALQARDGPRLSKLLREHLSYAWARFGAQPWEGA